MFGSPLSFQGAKWVRPTAVLATLSIATGPFGARLRSGTISLAHPELKVPRTPTTALFDA
jgi:hypothetical protein